MYEKLAARYSDLPHDLIIEKNNALVSAWWASSPYLTIQTKLDLLQDWVNGKNDLMIPVDDMIEILKEFGS